MNPLMSRWQGQYALTSQQLIPTQLMQKSFSILQMPIEELSVWVHDQILNNPALEWDEPSEERSYTLSRTQDNTHILAKKSTKELLLEQIQQTFTQKEEQILATDILENVNSKGLLLEEEAQRLRFTYDLDLFEKVLKTVQELEPIGTAARNLQDYLLIQLVHRGKKDSLAYQIIAHHYELLLSKDIAGLSRALKVPVQEIGAVLKKQIRFLRLSSPWDAEETVSTYLFPDLGIHYTQEGWSIEIYDAAALNFHVSERFMDQIEKGSSENRAYLKQMVSSGHFMKNCIEKRQKTLKRIANWIIKKQNSFLLQETSTPAPASIKELAESLDLHPSTITRAISEKILDCAQGLIPLKKLFSSAIGDNEGKQISQACALMELKKIISAENKSTPLSDTQLLNALKQKGIHCARRTVAKYRNTLSIPARGKRKKLF